MIAIALEQPAPAEIDVIAAHLAQTYWSPGIPRAVVERAWANSVCGLARRDGGDLVGFARVVSDWATFAWLCDVFVVPEVRGRGLARGLVAALMAAPDLQGLRRWALATADAHGVYAPLGFAPISAPERWMEIKRSSPYGVLTA